MRNSVVREIERMAEADSRIMVVTADLGYGVLERFAQRFPKRYFNVGIAEQLMASATAGMALSGNIVFTYSIGNFATLRCIEQIRNDICYHNANVKILAVGGGFTYGQLGMSHHATEDLAMMRALPNMRVFTPSDPEEAVAAVQYAAREDGPCYIRLARGSDPLLYQKEKELHVDKIQEVLSGKDAALFACGPLLGEAIYAAKILREKQVFVSVFSVPCIKPLDIRKIQELAVKYSLFITLEEHQTAGGLGGAIAEVLSEMRSPRAWLHRLGLKDEYTSIVGSHAYLCEHYGLSAEKIAESVISDLS